MYSKLSLPFNVYEKVPSEFTVASTGAEEFFVVVHFPLSQDGLSSALTFKTIFTFIPSKGPSPDNLPLTSVFVTISLSNLASLEVSVICIIFKSGAFIFSDFVPSV